MDTLRSIIGDYRAFLREILQEISDAGFDMKDFVQMDHLCYRVSSLATYATKKEALSQVGTLLGETMVNGRPIAIYRLNTPIYYEQWRIDAVELPAPKIIQDKREGLEHVELVLFDNPATFLEKYKGKSFDMRAADRGINPEIGFKLPTYTVKFHLLNLPTVLYLQDKLGIHEVRDGV